MSQLHKVQPVPQDKGSVTPYIVVKGVARFIDFLKAAFDAVEQGRGYNEDGTIGHAEVLIGNRIVMMFDAKPEWPDTPAFLSLYVEDCDSVHRQAVRAGGTTVTALSTSAWGDRGSRVRDPFGNIWWIQTHVEDVPEAESVQRMQEDRYLQDMRIAQETLDHELRSRGGKG